ncbi:MAG: hypothetical protein WAV90_20230 [Gordonia amarae]
MTTQMEEATEAKVEVPEDETSPKTETSPTTETSTETPASTKREASGASQPRQIAISVRSLAVGAALIALAAATIVFALLWMGARSDVSDRDAKASNEKRAEQISLDYAVGAATTDYQKLDEWFATLKKGTTSELAAKFDATSGSLKQILAPLGWKSTAEPITAVTKSENDGVYKVDAFVNVSSTSSQAPNGATTTVTYSITIDSKHDWQITDVGGLQSIVGK